jgi:hypothetical protein
MPSFIFPQGALHLTTRRGGPIDNYFNRDEVIPGHIAHCAAYRTTYNNPELVQHRPTEPTYIYNCHGLTFASRRTAINDPVAVRKILAEDEYIRVPQGDTLPGDVVIYVSQEGDIPIRAL